MAFPITYLLVANKLLETENLSTLSTADQALFLLGSIAPDGVHYRKGFEGAEMKNIGEQKKITHLCQKSNERWGQVLDNDGWEAYVRDFLNKNRNDIQALGYAAHVLTDIYNNKGIWDDFRTKYPEEAARGYKSDYYRDLSNIDILLYFNLYHPSNIEARLAQATAKNMPGLVSAVEIHAIRDHLLYNQYKNPIMPTTETYNYVTYSDVLEFIEDATAYCAKILFTSTSNGA